MSRIIMSGYMTIIGLLCAQALCGVMSAADERPENSQQQQHVWPMDGQDRQQLVERQQYETVGDAVLRNASPYPKVARRGYAGEEFFLKASKSVPRIGRRNNDGKESPKRSTANKDQMVTAEFWPYFQPNDGLARKRNFELEFGCQQLDAKTMFLADMYNLVCNDQFYCCATPTKHVMGNAPNVNYL